ncbi:unnamed protein product [Trichobilharzia regenti]|nr:unnamed protein product [Trichobilharzia regenti]
MYNHRKHLRDLQLSPAVTERQLLRNEKPQVKSLIYQRISTVQQSITFLIRKSNQTLWITESPQARGTTTSHLRYVSISLSFYSKGIVDKERLFKTNDKSDVKRSNTLIKLEMQRLNILYNQRFLSCKSPSSLWKLFKEITTGKRCTTVSSLNVDTLNKSIIRSSVEILPNATNHIDNNFSGFNTPDVLKFLWSLKPFQILGPDGVPAIILRDCADVLYYSLTNIFNASFSCNILPFAWKNIKIIPIPEPSSGSDIKFRPIAITSLFLKLIEELLLLRLEPSLKPFNDPKQFAYKHGRITLDAAVMQHFTGYLKFPAASLELFLE